MKFWEKAYLCVIISFLLAFDITAFLIVRKTSELSRLSEISAAESEYFIINKSLTERLISVSDYYTIFNKDNIKQYVGPYAQYYKSQGISMAFYLDNKLAYSNLTEQTLNQMELLASGERQIQLQHIESVPYLSIADFLDIEEANIRFIYIKDVTKLEAYCGEIAGYMVKISIIVSIGLSVVSIGLLLRLTYPLRKLNKGAEEISKGNYNQRVSVKSSDEIGEFANIFNAMAGHVEEHINKLMEVSDEKQMFIDNLSHEMRTPIAAIVGYGELLKNADIDDEQRLSAIDYIINQGTRLQNLSAKLLNFSSIKHNNYDMKPVKLSKIINSVLHTLRDDYEAKGIYFHLNISHDTIIGDADLLESLFQNLFENAIRVLDKNGKITVETEIVDGYICVDITDNGPGIAPKELSHIMEPFYRADKSRSRRQGGVGLGLSICKEICDIHQAKLVVCSNREEDNDLSPVNIQGLESGTKIKIYFTNTLHLDDNSKISMS